MHYSMSTPHCMVCRKSTRAPTISEDLIISEALQKIAENPISWFDLHKTIQQNEKVATLALTLLPQIFKDLNSEQRYNSHWVQKLLRFHPEVGLDLLRPGSEGPRPKEQPLGNNGNDDPLVVLYSYHLDHGSLQYAGKEIQFVGQLWLALKAIVTSIYDVTVWYENLPWKLPMRQLVHDVYNIITLENRNLYDIDLSSDGFNGTVVNGEKSVEILEGILKQLYASQKQDRQFVNQDRTASILQDLKLAAKIVGKLCTDPEGYVWDCIVQCRNSHPVACSYVKELLLLNDAGLETIGLAKRKISDCDGS